jgi:hypothetical protein
MGKQGWRLAFKMIIIFVVYMKLSSTKVVKKLLKVIFLKENHNLSEEQLFENIFLNRSCLKKLDT